MERTKRRSKEIGGGNVAHIIFIEITAECLGHFLN